MSEDKKASIQAQGKGETTLTRRIIQLFTGDSKRVYLILAPLVGILTGVFAFGLGTCFGPLLVPLVILAIPYYLGIKEVIRLLQIGLIALLIGSVVLAGLYGFVIYERSPLISSDSVSSTDGVIREGRVSPMKGLPGEEYNFTMTIDPLKAKGNVITVYFRVRDYLMERRSLGLNGAPVFNETGTKINSTSYYRVLRLPRDTVYFVEFQVESVNGTASTWSIAQYGLLVVSTTSIWNVISSMAPMTMFNMLLFPYLTIFLMFLSVLWWMRKSRERRMDLQKEIDELEKEQEQTKKKAEESEFACTSCGASVKEEDTVCPKCGARFEDEEDASSDSK